MRTDQEPRAGTRAGARRAVLPELGFAVAAAVCYLAVRGYTVDRTEEAVSHARHLLSLERLLGLDWEHAVQDATLSVPGLSGFVTQFYVWAYFPLLIAITVWLYLTHREAYRSMRNALLASGVVGLVVYAVFPCAPPWIGGTGFTDTVAAGPFHDVARPSGVTNHLGAVPSFHVGWVMLVAVVVHRVARSRVQRILCVLYPVLMSYAVVATGNHWVLDIPAGAALAAVGLVVGGHVTGVRLRRRIAAP